MAYKSIKTARANARNYQRRRRQEAIIRLGGKCVRCGFSDWRALDIDHVNGDGKQDRELRGYTALHNDIRQGYVDLSHYQVLCANCHRIKAYESGEHDKRRK